MRGIKLREDLWWIPGMVHTVVDGELILELELILA